MKKIITSVVDALSKDSARKFVYVEQVYFQMWWNDQNADTKELVRRLVKGASNQASIPLSLIEVS